MWPKRVKDKLKDVLKSDFVFLKEKQRIYTIFDNLVHDTCDIRNSEFSYFLCMRNSTGEFMYYIPNFEISF